jgi:hypothetical protein
MLHQVLQVKTNPYFRGIDNGKMAGCQDGVMQGPYGIMRKGVLATPEGPHHIGRA